MRKGTFAREFSSFGRDGGSGVRAPAFPGRPFQVRKRTGFLFPPSSSVSSMSFGTMKTAFSELNVDRGFP